MVGCRAKGLPGVFVPALHGMHVGYTAGMGWANVIRDHCSSVISSEAEDELTFERLCACQDKKVEAICHVTIFTLPFDTCPVMVKAFLCSGQAKLEQGRVHALQRGACGGGK